jgi:hypothetical protein
MIVSDTNTTFYLNSSTIQVGSLIIQNNSRALLEDCAASFVRSLLIGLRGF